MHVDKLSVGGIRQENNFALGRQLTIEYYECGPDRLLNKDQVETAMLKAADESGATIISSSFNEFNPQGISGVVVIAESHFTIHTWPEHNYAAVDIFTCGDNIDLEIALNSMRDSFASENVVISSDQNRGIITKPVLQENTKDSIQNAAVHPISWRREYDRKDPWGVLTSVDIYEADPEIIRDAEKIKSFVKDLCNLIDMRRFGECQIVHFGDDRKVEGFSMTQLIETSLISGHFANASNTVYLDIFSCKYYDPRQAAEFSMNFFKGAHYKLQIAMRQ